MNLRGHDKWLQPKEPVYAAVMVCDYCDQGLEEEKPYYRLQGQCLCKECFIGKALPLLGAEERTA